MVILSKSEMLKEFESCLKDPCYMIQTYFQTFDKTNEGYVPYKLFPKQIEIIDSYEKHKNNIVTKPRQAGVSTTTAAYYAVKAALADKSNPEQILIIANKQDLAQEFLGKVKEFLTQVPRFIWGSDYFGNEKKEKESIFLVESKKEIKLPNGSRVKAVATSKDALRGFTPTRLVMDEAAFIDNGEIVFGAAQTSMGTGGRCTLISTPNGQDRLYYRTYDLAKLGKNNFNVIEMKWYQDPRYNKNLVWKKKDCEDIVEELYTIESLEQKISEGYKPSSDWYEDMCRSMNYDERQIAQELDVSFIGSGGNVVSDEYIDFHNKTNVQDPIYIDNKYFDGNSGEVYIWKYPEQGHRYVAAVDVSRGDGEDYSVISILDFETMEQVLEYQGKIQPDLFANIIDEYCSIYDAYVIVDIAGGMGVTTVLKLLEIGYPKLHYDNVNQNLLKNKQKKLADYSRGNDSKIPGFNVSGVRLNMIQNLEEKIRLNAVKIRSKRVISELKTFVYRNGRPDHMKGYNDDCLISLAMALFIMEYHFKELSRLENIDKAILSSWVMAGTQIKTNPDDEFQKLKELKRKEVVKKYKMMPLGNLNNSVNTINNRYEHNNNVNWLFSKKRR